MTAATVVIRGAAIDVTRYELRSSSRQSA